MNCKDSAFRLERVLKLLIPLAIAFLLEVFLFNCAFWKAQLGGTGLGAFDFQPFRLAMLACVCCYVYLFLPKSMIYGMRLRFRGFQAFVIISFVLLHAVSFVAISLHVHDAQFFTSGATKFDGAVYDDGQQYAYLANSLLSGELWLDLDVPDWLASMDNPYDAEERFKLANETGEPFYWDFAFFEGHYYCYFGVLPAIVAFVPFKLITGMDLPTDCAVAFFAILAAIAIAVFLYKAIRHYFPSASLGSYLLSFILFSMGCGILNQVFYPLFYSLPPLASMACLFFGLSFWIDAKAVQGQVRLRDLVLGSLMIALTLACRPQMFLAILLAFPLFWDEIRKERLFFSRKGIGNTLAIILPCLLVGCLLMWYNHARFGSPFDFGASYNLTGFDMTQKGHGIDPHTLLISLLFYLVMPLDVKSTFPFLDEIDWRSGVPVEPFYGSFFAFTPAALALLGLYHYRRQLRERRLLLFSATCVVLAIVLLAISAQIASVSMRYFSDFSWALLIPALFVWLVAIESAASKRASCIVIFLFAILTLAGEALSYWSLLAVGRYGSVAAMNPDLFSAISNWFSALS